MPNDARGWHFGVLSFTGAGHLNPLIALGQELLHRGHRVTFFERSKIQDRVHQAGLAFVALCGERSAKPVKPHGRSGIGAEIAMLRFNLARVVRDVEQYLCETPAALANSGIDALLVNEIACTGPTLAQLLCLPYVVISTSVPHNLGWDAFPRFTGYRNSRPILSGVERALLEISALRVRGPIQRVLDRYRKAAGLGPLRLMPRTHPPMAQITQMPRLLDLPQARLPQNFYYTGPFVSRQSRPSIDFPWEQLDGRPIIYASLGTTRNVQAAILRMIAEAVQDLGVQLVISLGDRFSPEQFADLPGHPLVTRFAPQLELLKLATLVITHSGPNTAFESLMEGKPMVAIPIAYDQPAIARRLAHAGVAQVLPVMRLSAKRIRSAVSTVLQEPSFRNAAIALQAKLRSIHGVDQAAQIIEESLQRHLANRRAANGSGLSSEATNDVTRRLTLSP